MQVQGRSLILASGKKRTKQAGLSAYFWAASKSSRVEIENARVLDRVSLALHGDKALGGQRHGAQQAARQKRRMAQQVTVVAAFDENGLLALAALGREKVHVNAERLLPHLDEHRLVGTERAAAPLAFHQDGRVVVNVLLDRVHRLLGPIL